MLGECIRLRRRANRFPFWVLALVVLTVAGCGRTRSVSVAVPPPPSQPSPEPPSSPNAPPAPSAEPGAPPIVPAPAFSYVEQGTASWYGIPFDGRRAANGEIFDMRLPVAAHRTLPFGSIVRVTNLNNGLQTEVRIIDRGPFVAGRIIDLSLAAARTLNLVGTGTAPVRIELLSSPVPLAGAFAVQVGAFTLRENAERVRMRLAARYTPILIDEADLPGGHFFRVRVGRAATPEAASRLATRLAGEGGLTQTFVVRLDEMRCCATSPGGP